jgi:hypothetical protein
MRQKSVACKKVARTAPATWPGFWAWATQRLRFLNLFAVSSFATVGKGVGVPVKTLKKIDFRLAT